MLYYYLHTFPFFLFLFALFTLGLTYEHCRAAAHHSCGALATRDIITFAILPHGRAPHLTEHGRSNDAAWEWESGPHLQNVDFGKAT